MKPLRLIGITMSAGSMTLATLFTMQGLAGKDTLEFNDEPVYYFPEIPIQEEIPPIDPANKFILPEPPEPVILPDPPQDIPFDDGNTGPVQPTPPPPAPAAPKDVTTQFTNGDGEMIPIVRVQPMYPRRAQERGIEGWVIVRFTVDEHGMVVDPYITEAEPAGYFETTALKTIAKFKYKPKTVDGRALRTENIRYKMSFTLNGD